MVVSARWDSWSMARMMDMLSYIYMIMQAEISSTQCGNFHQVDEFYELHKYRPTVLCMPGNRALCLQVC